MAEQSVHNFHDEVTVYRGLFPHRQPLIVQADNVWKFQLAAQRAPGGEDKNACQTGWKTYVFGGNEDWSTLAPETVARLETAYERSATLIHRCNKERAAVSCQRRGEGWPGLVCIKSSLSKRRTIRVLIEHRQ